MSKNKQSNNQNLEVSLDEVDFFKKPQPKVHREEKCENLNIPKFIDKWKQEILTVSAILLGVIFTWQIFSVGMNTQKSVREAIVSKNSSQIISVIDASMRSDMSPLISSGTLELSVEAAIAEKKYQLLSQIIDRYKDQQPSVFLDRERATSIISSFSTKDEYLPYLKSYWDTFGKELQSKLDHDNIGKRSRDMDHMLEVALQTAGKDHQMKILSYAVSQITDEGIINGGFSSAIASNDMTLARFYADHGADLKNRYLVRDVVSTLIDRNNIEGIKLMVEHGTDIHYSDDEALRTAQRLGHTEIANYIKSVPVQDICPKDYECIIKKK